MGEGLFQICKEFPVERISWPASRAPNSLEVESVTERRRAMKGSRFSEEQSSGFCERRRQAQRHQRYVGGTGSQARHFTSMDGSPWQEGFGSWSGDDRLQTSIRRHHFMVRPNGKSAHTRLNKWSASRAIIKVRV
jgi:hypothetical protein